MLHQPEQPSAPRTEMRRLSYLLPHDFLAHPAVCKLLLRRKINSDPRAYRDGVEAACQEMYPGVGSYDQAAHIRLLRNFHEFYKEPGEFRRRMDALHQDDVRMLKGETLSDESLSKRTPERAALQEAMTRIEAFLVKKISSALNNGLGWMDIRAIYGMILDGGEALIDFDDEYQRGITNALKALIQAGATMDDIRGVLGRVRSRFPEDN